MNIVLLQGVLARPAEVRQLPSGAEVVEFDVSIRPAEGPAETVPVVWQPSPADATRAPGGAALAPMATLPFGSGDAIVVTGRVRRRFFRSGGQTQSRTEVVADAVVPLRQRHKAKQALERATASSILPTTVAAAKEVGVTASLRNGQGRKRPS